jgi:hypothetical protein
MEEKLNDCSWQEVYKLNGVIVDGDEEFDSLDLDDIDTLVVEFSSPLKPIVRFGFPEIILGR